MTKNTPMLRILEAQPAKGFRVKVWLSDGTSRTLDTEPFLKGPVFARIKKDPVLFSRVKALHGTLVWPNGADLDPDVLLGTAVARRVVARFKQAMPAICQFDGATIYVYHNDHPPPHIHVKQSGEEALVAILTGKIIEGEIPKPLHKTVKQWLKDQRPAILEAYVKAQSGQPPGKVPPP